MTPSEPFTCSCGASGPYGMRLWCSGKHTFEACYSPWCMLRLNLRFAWHTLRCKVKGNKAGIDLVLPPTTKTWN